MAPRLRRPYLDRRTNLSQSYAQRKAAAKRGRQLNISVTLTLERRQMIAKHFGFPDTNATVTTEVFIQFITASVNQLFITMRESLIAKGLWERESSAGYAPSTDVKPEPNASSSAEA